MTKKLGAALVLIAAAWFLWGDGNAAETVERLTEVALTPEAADAPKTVDEAPAEEQAGMADADAEAAASSDGGRGPVTNLPMPRFVSLKTSEGNARRGPSLSHRIDWVFVRRDMPLQITGEYGHWRRVRDRDGAGGWMHYSLLSGVRTVVLTDPAAELRLRADTASPVLARVEEGVIARLGECLPGWCHVSAGGRSGWVPKTALWGVKADELRD